MFGVAFQKWPNSPLELPEGISQTLGGVGCCGEILLGCRHLELLNLGVEADHIGIIHGVQDTVPNVADSKDIAAAWAGASRPRWKPRRPP